MLQIINNHKQEQDVINIIRNNTKSYIFILEWVPQMMICACGRCCCMDRIRYLSAAENPYRGPV